MRQMARYAAILALLSVAWACPLPSRASDAACPPVPVETDRLVNARWPSLPGRVGAALEGRRDIDNCARITIRLDTRAIAAPAIVLEVVLRDGRSTSRSVSRAEDVIPILEALLLLPAVDTSLPGAGPVSAAVQPARAATLGSARGPATVEFAAVEPAAPTMQPGRLGIEFSIAAGARIGDGQAGVGVAARTSFDLGGWLLGFEGAADHYQGIESGSSAAVLKLAVLAGRRFRLGSMALDLTAGPAVAMNGFGNKVAVQAGTGASVGLPPPESDGLQKRLACGARLTFRGGSVRTFAGVEGELALEKSPTAPMAVEPRLPGWTAGLIVGATVGTP